MSTTSYIGKLNADGTVRAIYVHFDGYPDAVGKRLVNHYKTEERIDQLLDLGNMSSLGDNPIGCWHEHGSYDHINCETYRERGEEDQDAIVCKSISEFLDNCIEDYTYLFKDGQWFYRQSDNTDLIPLTKNERKYDLS